MTAVLPLAAADHQVLLERVRRLAENRPGTYRMTDEAGRLLYVGKAKRLRTRLLTYFRAAPHDRAARILHAARDLAWDYAPSEFAARLAELRLIRRHRPPWNVQYNRSRRLAFVRVTAEAAPRLLVTAAPGEEGRSYGPFVSPARVLEAIRVLADLLGLRDCAARMPVVFAAQEDLFAQPALAACPRHAFGTCAGPCAGLVAHADYAARVETAAAFLEGRTVRPIDRAVAEMARAAEEEEFERAVRWRERYEALEWLLGSVARARAARDLLTFVYRDPGSHGDDRAYLLRGGEVRATFPWPGTPIEAEAFRGVVREELARPITPTGPLPAERVDEILLVMSWFRTHPDALRRTTPLEEWA
ncbi:MAG TPA: GIY-YIG nuclease family protein [Gemmatimonadales bacterium]|nr:GIY-YIG nuclease family protein [Gemmatimonadales bacterium]